ncbi:MAG: TIGR04282 family arsenosugar biosynthesis glycosyltransferase [Polyangiales bacterium]
MPPPAAVVLFAKEPSPERSKTRLAPSLSAEQRRSLAEAMLDDKIAQVSAIDAIKPVLAWDPLDAEARMRARCSDRWALVSQGGGTLGERLSRVCDALFHTGFSAVILIGSDSPTMPPERITRALALLEARPVVIGPADDGGYYLLGLATRAPSLFEDIEWSTERVFEQTLAKIHAENLAYEALPSQYDVDVPEDLARLQSELESESARALAPRTARVMDEIRRARLAR